MKITEKQVEEMFKEEDPATFLTLGLLNLLANKEVITMDERNQIIAFGTQVFLSKHPELKVPENDEESEATEPASAPTENDDADLE